MSSSPAVHESHHPTFKQYVIVALILFAITAVEFLIIVPDDFKGKGWTIAPLAGLSIIKFAIVIFFYMHLKFDNKLFTWIFLGGLALGAAVVFALVTLFFSYTPSPRQYAQIHAVPFSHEGGGAEHPAEPKPASEQTQPEGQAPEPSGSEPAAAPAASAADGEAIFLGAGGCAACHTIEGTTAQGKLGPDLTHIGADGASRQDGVSARDYITESIKDPEAFVASGVERANPGLMTSAITASLSDSDVASLVEFLLEQE
jgi:heme/copper-type cytochrome/quinol oxidase subunit 4/mono/diheme cytochrome c family protein